MKLAAFIVLSALALGNSRPPVVALVSKSVIVETVGTERWEWSETAQGHTKVTIRDASGKVLRVFVFEINLR